MFVLLAAALAAVLTAALVMALAAVLVMVLDAVLVMVSAAVLVMVLDAVLTALRVMRACAPPKPSVLVEVSIKVGRIAYQSLNREKPARRHGRGLCHLCCF